MLEGMVPTHSDIAGDGQPPEDEFDQARRLLGSDISPVVEQRLRQDVLLQRQYRGQYVAFVDRWKIQAGVRKLVRDVIAAAATPWDLEKELDRLSAVDRKALSRVFIEDFPRSPEPIEGNE